MTASRRSPVRSSATDSRNRASRAASAVVLGAGEARLEALAGQVVGHRLAEPGQPGRVHHVRAGPGGQALRRELDVAAALERGGAAGLVGGLVGAETDVAVRAED